MKKQFTAISPISVAKPHTIKKFELISHYVDEWARKILGYDKSAGIIYIDCMCNCGVYYDEDGTLIDGTAILVVKALDDIISNYSGKKAILYFNISFPICRTIEVRQIRCFSLAVPVAV